jgi:alpha-glucoside transport system permease protein
MRTVFRNNLLWIVFVTTFSTLFGLLMAVLADRVKHESLAKALVFLPMAISFVGASVIWRFVYDSSRLSGEEQIGLLNAVWVGMGNDPVFWLLETPWNNFLLIVAMIWMQTGFAMIVLSSAIKGVPTELLEAARIDGADEWKVFRHVTLPSIAGTIAVVVTTTIILVLKVFDIVRVMTGGRDETSVIANEMIDAIGIGRPERAGALAVLLFVAVIPILVYNVRRFRREEAMR